MLRRGVEHALFARHERRRNARLAQTLVDFQREQTQRREVDAALGFAQEFERRVRLARIGGTGEIFERGLRTRKTFEIETQAERGFHTRVDAAVLQRLILAYEAAPRILERREERGVVVDVAPLDVVGLAQNLDGGALHRVPEFGRGGIDQRRDRALAFGSRQFAGHFDRHPAADHDDPRPERELPLDLDLDHVLAG